MRIETKEIGYAYRTNEILKGVSVSLEPGKFTGILGPNGSGKSTFLKCIYRVLEPDSGVILLDGKEEGTFRMKETARMFAVMAQHSSYNFDFKVEEVVMMGRSPHKKMLERDSAKDYQIVREALDEVGMLAFAERDFSTLSGGEQQRVILARALAQQTECLILDEPTNHLDITYQLSLMKILKEQKLTIFAAMHDLNLAAMFCDYLYIMKDGTIWGSGAPEEILTPETIREVYDVKAQTIRDENGKLHILFLE